MKINEGWHSEIFLTNKGTIIKKFKENLRKNYEKEKYFLLKLSNYNFIPRIISWNDNELWIEIEYINCKKFEDIIKEKSLSKETVEKILDICYILDKLGIEKEEMNRPYKHIFVCENRIILIDWERAREKKSTSNLTQFIQFLIKEKYIERNEILINLLKEYKRSKENYNKLKEYILNNLTLL